MRFYLLACALVLLAPACSRAPKSVPPVDARTMGTYAMWRSDVADRLTAEQWREFEGALQELRLQAMAAGASGKEAIDEALCGAINGKTFSDVVRAGYTAKLGRLEPMYTQLKGMVDANALLIAKPGDSDVGDVLERKRDDQLQRLRSLAEEINSVRQRMLGLGVETRSDPFASPTALTRREALAEIDQLLSIRRERAAFTYGDWPIKVDFDGATLADAEWQQLQAAKAAALSNHTVAAVRIRGKWRIFDDVVATPEFSPAVLANLTDADRQLITRRWRETEILAWAERRANEEPAGKPMVTRPRMPAFVPPPPTATVPTPAAPAPELPPAPAVPLPSR